ncbi:L-idonate 5-dehydrogenase [Rodentibacter trehalosifermentans]|uniref:L-idonate 5-dehydrogenase n=1 Tax=Rodentibacter trehalosifermentans TaxID=1908263 RepID=A0A1V3J7M6_9PAST|nr:L-idonate 5-dehydrogenase [Rodentibacter trehalosifermentans]OOF51289.1 L-idonate 5-dehydrogenase [Rodentibacter trehalosifermentans]
MKIKTLSCVVKCAENVGIIEQDLQYDDGDQYQTLIRISRGGICGSDLHYYQHGKVGNFAVKHPMILGHEVIGRIIKTNSPNLRINQKVAINPSKPCHSCKYCLSGDINQCESMRFFGSAMYNPHVDGGFTQYKVVDNTQCIPYPEDIDDEIMVFAEPLAVAIHAAKQGGDLKGKRVFISGVGPIGCLVVASVKALGAQDIICTDISQRCLNLALEMGATKVLHANDDFSEYAQHKGEFDVAFEASGHPSSIERCLEVTKAKGTIVQIGMGGNLPNFPLMTLIAKEINWKGSFRFVEEFNTAVNWLASNKVNPLPLLSATFSFKNFEDALKTAGNKNDISKVQIIFS